MLVIDATNATLGRLSSFAVKQALLGKRVILVNCAKAVITGGRKMIIKEYIIKRQRGGSSLNGPHFPKNSEKVFKRTIRGMLRYKTGRGETAYKNIICYNDVPKEFEAEKKIQAGKEKRTTTITLNELSQEL